MDIAAIFFTLAVLTLVSVFIAQPYLQKKSRRGQLLDHDLSALLAEYDRTVSSLQEMDFDYTLGKIPQDDFPKQRAELLSRGAEVLRQLDSPQTKISRVLSKMRQTHPDLRPLLSILWKGHYIGNPGHSVLTSVSTITVKDPP
jgi:hypothetical protein